MSEIEQLEMLKNAVREPVSALTAVEVDSRFRADQIIRLLQQEIKERPLHTIAFSASDRPVALLENARRAVSSWDSHQGVLCLTDAGGTDEKTSHDFWEQMNFLRESWGSLDCHVIFFLVPGSFLMMLRTADHLADWIPLKFHILGMLEKPSERDEYLMRDYTFSENEMSIPTARQTLSALQESLAKAIHQDVEKKLLVRRYYLPMFEAAMTLYDLQRAQSLRRNISEEDITESELPEWLYENYDLDLKLRNLDQAEHAIQQLLDWAKGKNHPEWEAIAYHAMGRIAQERQYFDAAESWYRKSLEISEKHGNELGAAITYHQLGIIAQEKRDFDAAASWYRKSLEIFERHGNELGAAITYGQLGILARLQRLFEESGRWLIRCIQLFAKCNDPAGVQRNTRNFQITYNQADPETQEKLKAMWEGAGLQRLAEL